MKNKLLLGIGIVTAGVLVAIARQENPPAPVSATAAAVAVPEANWLTDFEAAKATARTENKPLLVDFTGSDWCPPCMMLEKQVFSQPEFATYAARKLVLVRVDFPRRKPLPAAQQAANDQLAQRYGIRGFPTILVMNADGSVKGQLGYAFSGAAGYVEKIEDLLTKS